MATVPQYGGTNSVTELDVGQPGGTLNPTLAWYVVRTQQQGAEAVVTDQRLPQQVAGFVDIQGPLGGVHVWSGNLKVATVDTFRVVRSNIERALHGHPVNADGSWGAFAADEIRPTTLIDGLGQTISLAAKLVQYRMGEQFTLTGPTFFYLTRLSLIFKVIR